MRQLPCQICGRLIKIGPSWQHRRTLKCDNCRATKHLVELLSSEHLVRQLPEIWTRELFQGYTSYLEARLFQPDTRYHYLQVMIPVGKWLGERLSGPTDLSPALLDEALSENQHSRAHPIRPSLLAYLRDAGVLPALPEDEGALRAITSGVSALPLAFRQPVQSYVEFRLEVHREQLRENLSRVLSLRTIVEEVGALRRFVRYLQEHHPAVTSWDLVTQAEVVQYLRSLEVQPTSRDVARWKLHGFFEYFLRHHYVTHNPVPDDPSREVTPVFNSLSSAEQTRLLERWAKLEDPLESLVGFLGLLHGLTTGDLRLLKLADYDRELGRLRVTRRPFPLQVDQLTRQALEAYLKVREGSPKLRLSPYLIANTYSRFSEKPVSRRYLIKRIRVAGVTQQQLRFTCLSTYAQETGPRLLVDALGLSPAQASRYQHFLAYRAEQALAEHDSEVPKR